MMMARMGFRKRCSANMFGNHACGSREECCLQSFAEAAFVPNTQITTNALGMSRAAPDFTRVTPAANKGPPWTDGNAPEANNGR